MNKLINKLKTKHSVKTTRIIEKLKKEVIQNYEQGLAITNLDYWLKNPFNLK